MKPGLIWTDVANHDALVTHKELVHTTSGTEHGCNADTFVHSTALRGSFAKFTFEHLSGFQADGLPGHETCRTSSTRPSLGHPSNVGSERTHLGGAASSIARHFALAFVHKVIDGFHRGNAIFLQVCFPQRGS